MGAAVPTVLPKTIEKLGIKKTLYQILGRFISILGLAVFSFNFAPLRNLSAGENADLAGIVTYLGFFLLFAKIPHFIPQRNISLKISGLFLLMGLAYFKNSFWGGFDLANNDSILRVLANVYLVGTVLWFLSRHNELMRIGFIFMVLSAYLGDIDTGYLQGLWRWKDPWNLVSPYLLKYLILFLMGTLVGDWMIKKEFSFHKSKFQVENLILGISITLLVLFGLFQRNIGFAWLGSILAISYFFYKQKMKREIDLLSNKLFYSGIFILFCGLLMEPFQGGVKKDPSTLSYFFISGGIAILWVQSFLGVEHDKIKSIFNPILYLGQNALMAYFMAGFLIIPLLNIFGLSQILGTAPIVLIIKAVLVTGFLLFLVNYLTRKGVFWKI